MPRCEGRPNQACSRNDNTVRSTQGDLFLCPECEEFRFPSKPYLRASTTAATVATTRMTPTTTATTVVTRNSGRTRNARKTITTTNPNQKRDCRIVPPSTSTSATAMANSNTVSLSTRIKSAHAGTKATSCTLNNSTDEVCCPNCLEIVDIDEDHIKCDTCGKYLHQGCTGMTLDVFKLLKSFVHQSCWVCYQCRCEINNVQVLIGRTNEQLADMQLSLAKLSREVDDLKLANEKIGKNKSQSMPPAALPAVSSNLPASKTDSSDITAVVHRTVRDITRRKRNVVISGLSEAMLNSESDNKAADEAAFVQLCETNLPIKPALAPKGCTRLGRYDGHRPRRLLVHLTSEQSASSLLAAAKILRNSDDQYTAEYVYINPDLSPAEAKEAYNRRQRRRALAETQGRGSPSGRETDADGDFPLLVAVTTSTSASTSTFTSSCIGPPEVSGAPTTSSCATETGATPCASNQNAGALSITSVTAPAKPETSVSSPFRQ